VILWLPLYLALAQNAFVPTSGGVAVIDTVAGTTIATLPLEAGNAAVSTDGGTVYVTQTASQTVLALDAKTLNTLATIGVGKGATGVAVSPDGTRAYVTNQLDNSVSVIDAAKLAVAATIAVGARPFGIAVAMDGLKVYVANSGANTVTVIDTVANAVAATVTLPFPVAPCMAAVSQDGAKVYVTDNGYGHVYVISTATDTLTGSLQPASYNQGVAFSPNGAQAYVTDAAGAVNVVDAVNDTVLRAIPLGGNPAGVAFSTDGTKAYVANGSLNEIQVVDTTTGAVTVIGAPNGPTGFGIFIQPGGAPNVTGVANGFTFEDGESPGAFVVITGTNLASGNIGFTGTSLPTSLGATSVLLDGIPIPLFYVTPTQINAQIPVDALVSLASIEVVNGTETSGRLEFAIDAAAPGIPFYMLNGTEHAAAQNGDGSANSPSNAAAAGSLITIYFTGIGPVTNQAPSGRAAPVSPLSNSLLQVTVSIGGQIIEPAFAGLAPGSIGLAQANVQVPVLAPGDYPVAITVGGSVSNSVLVSIGN
jgi:uncharacterized protein (TIGR03437 family)